MLRVMCTEDEPGEPSAKELRERAERLRESARRAEALVEPLETHIDAEVEIATTQGVWTGQYAGEATTQLTEYQRELRTMAQDLEDTLAEWRAQANRLDEQADEKE